MLDLILDVLTDIAGFFLGLFGKKLTRRFGKKHRDDAEGSRDEGE